MTSTSTPATSRGLGPSAREDLVDGRRPLLVRGATVLTQDPELGDLATGDVLVEGGRITAVGPDLADRAPADAVVLDAFGQIVIPGLVDSHVHAWEGLLRGAGPTVDFGGYLGLTAFGFGPRHTPTQAYAGTLATALVALDAGTTTLVDNAHNALTPDHARAGVEALLDAGVRGVHAVGSPFGAELEHVPHTAVALRDRFAGDTVSVRLFEVHPDAERWRVARDEGLWVSTETGPHTPDVDAVLVDLARQGLLGPTHTLNHCYDLAESTWDAIADCGATVNLAPRSDAAFGLGSTVLAVDAAYSRGVTTGLSGDNEVSYALSLFADMQSLLLRSRSETFRRRHAGEDGGEDGNGEGSAWMLTPQELLRAATLGGAANAGLADQVGSLTPGKRADLVILEARRPSLLGVVDPYAAVTAFAHPGCVDTVLVGGRLRKLGGELVGVDVEAARDLIVRERDALRPPYDAVTSAPAPADRVADRVADRGADRLQPTS